MHVRTVTDAAAVVRGRRSDLGLSQAALAERAGVSRKWIYEFEAGKPTVELGLLLRVLEALGLSTTVTAGAQAADTGADAAIDLDVLLDRYRAGDA